MKQETWDILWVGFIVTLSFAVTLIAISFAAMYGVI